MFFEDDIDDSKYCGHLYGLGTNFVVGSNSGLFEFIGNAVESIEFSWQMLKAPPLKSLVIKCNCRTYDDNIGLKFKNLRFVFWRAYNMFDIKFCYV